MFISAVQQSDSVIYIYIYFHILYHYDLSWDSEYSSLAIQKHLAVYPSYIFTSTNPKLLILLSHTPDLVNHKFVLYVCESVSAL